MDELNFFYFLETLSLWERLFVSISWHCYSVWFVHFICLTHNVPLEQLLRSWCLWRISYDAAYMMSNGDAFSWMCLTLWYSSMTYCNMGEFLCIVSRRLPVCVIKCCFIGYEPVQSCRYLIAIYRGLLMTFQCLILEDLYSAMWTSTKFTKLIEPYSKIERTIVL